MARRISHSPEETLALGEALGRELKAPIVVALFGELGAGKTTFAKGIVSAVAGLSPHEVTSPTFTYLQVYSEALFHFDLYRLGGPDEFTRRGFDEHLEEGIVVIEWAERVVDFLPPDTLRITLHHCGAGEREVVYES